MLAQVDEKTLAMNIALLIGGLVLLGAFFLFTVAAITAIKCALWIRRCRKAEREFLAKYRRADGRQYPPFMEGICTQCGRGNNKVYFTATGEELCPPCYERSWRSEARQGAGRAASRCPRSKGQRNDGRRLIVNPRRC
jgi:hypothetical protein